MSDLPSPIVLDILSRIPTRLLLSLRRVCKTWRELILDPYFTRIRLTRRGVIDTLAFTPHAFYLYEHDRCFSATQYAKRHESTFKIPRKQLTLAGYSNGLLCLEKFQSPDTLYVCNPILGEYVALPKPKCDFSVELVAHMFGFCVATGQYKVLRIACNRAYFDFPDRCIYEKSEAQVCTLGTDTWRNIGDAPFPIYSKIDGAFCSKMCGALFKGALHWVTRDARYSESIHLFDIAKEQILTVPPPQGTGKKLIWMALGVLRNCLCMIDFDNFVFSHLDLWTMKDYGVAESWTKDCILVFSLQLQTLDYHIFLSKGREIVFGVEIGCLLSYNLETRNYSQFVLPGSESGLALAALVDYSPNFRSLKDIAGLECLRNVNIMESE